MSLFDVLVHRYVVQQFLIGGRCIRQTSVGVLVLVRARQRAGGELKRFPGVHRILAQRWLGVLAIRLIFIIQIIIDAVRIN